MGTNDGCLRGRLAPSQDVEKLAGSRVQGDTRDHRVPGFDRDASGWPFAPRVLNGQGDAMADGEPDRRRMKGTNGVPNMLEKVIG
jgi:hypothetical protein